MSGQRKKSSCDADLTIASDAKTALSLSFSTTTVTLGGALELAWLYNTVPNARKRQAFVPLQ